MDTSSISPNPNSERNCNGTEPVNHVSNDIADTSISNDGAQSSLPIDEYGKSVYTSKWLKEHTTIHGWLTFFMFAMAIGGFISAFGSLLTIKPEDYANNIFLISTDVLPGFCLLAVALYTIYAFNTRRPDAVFWGKFYVVMVLVTNVLSLAFKKLYLLHLEK